jgi:hypothetical protein
MGDTRLWERHAYEMAPVRGMPMIWPMRDARLWETRLWDGFCEKQDLIKILAACLGLSWSRRDQDKRH